MKRVPLSTLPIWAVSYSELARRETLRRWRRRRARRGSHSIGGRESRTADKLNRVSVKMWLIPAKSHASLKHRLPGEQKQAANSRPWLYTETAPRISRGPGRDYSVAQSSQGQRRGQERRQRDEISQMSSWRTTFSTLGEATYGVKIRIRIDFPS